MHDRPEALVNALAGRYEVERRLGRGGMATVFLGRSVTTGQAVAIKVLRPELVVTLAADRFLREIEILGRLRHPNILPLLDSGASGTVVYHVSPYASDGTLADRLQARGSLALPETVAIVRQVADALEYAHARRVVHRDIKPANILFEGDRVLVCDFGVARAVLEAASDHISSSGLIVGTPTYTSPEQAAGVTPDGRTDLYALGCVVYEMLCGEPPFRGPTPQAVLAKHAAQPPPSLRSVRPELPEHAERAVLAALAKHPQDRPATVGAFARLLAG
jgi:serine/threonine protein kinase